MVSILSNVSSSRKQSLFQVEVCKKEKVWYVVTVLVNTICNGILVSCVSVRGINVLIKKKKKIKKIFFDKTLLFLAYSIISLNNHSHPSINRTPRMIAPFGGDI